jgi:hypothetical protein
MLVALKPIIMIAIANARIDVPDDGGFQAI